MTLIPFTRTLVFLAGTTVLLSTSLPNARAQFSIDSSFNPFREFQLQEPREYCFDAFSRWGDLDNITDIGYLYIPDANHHGQQINYFVGFQRSSQPGKLWLLSDTFEWIEYRPGDTPVSPPISGLSSGIDYIVIHGHTYSGFRALDLSGLVNDGELLVGYGLRVEENSTIADAFREMLDGDRFSIVWRVGDSAPSDEVCIEYDSIKIGLRGIGTTARTGRTRALPYGSLQLSSPASLHINEIELSRKVARSPRLAYYSLLPEKPDHVGQPVDVFIGFRLEGSPDRWWLLAGGATPTWFEYSPDREPVTHIAGLPLTPSPWNAIALASAPAGAPADLNAAIADGAIYVGYGLGNAPTASFREMLDNQRMGRIWFSRHDEADVYLSYAKVRVKPATSTDSR